MVPAGRSGGERTGGGGSGGYSRAFPRGREENLGTPTSTSEKDPSSCPSVHAASLLVYLRNCRTEKGSAGPDRALPVDADLLGERLKQGRRQKGLTPEPAVEGDRRVTANTRSATCTGRYAVGECPNSDRRFWVAGHQAHVVQRAIGGMSPRQTCPGRVASCKPWPCQGVS